MIYLFFSLRRTGEMLRFQEHIIIIFNEFSKTEPQRCSILSWIGIHRQECLRESKLLEEMHLINRFSSSIPNTDALPIS